MLCLHLTIILIIRLFGTRKGMANWMIDNNKVIINYISYNFMYFVAHRIIIWYIFVYGCFSRKIRHLNYLVRQSPATRIFLQILIIIFSVEGVPDGSAFCFLFVINVFVGIIRLKMNMNLT
uniref:Uncharacterized protein n=1 Tax=Heterorhabditis bacteriophora TaxID=37862 RepID=A0A1I7WH61_HETBA